MVEAKLSKLFSSELKELTTKELSIRSQLTAEYYRLLSVMPITIYLAIQRIKYTSNDIMIAQITLSLTANVLVVLQAHCQTLKLEFTDFFFIYNGSPIDNTATAESLKLQDDSIIYIVPYKLLRPSSATLDNSKS